MPVAVNYAQFPDITDQLGNDIFNGLFQSKEWVTFNVDAPRANVMTLSVRSLGSPTERVEVTYSWKGEVVLTREVNCQAPRFEGCGRKIVEGAKDASRRLHARQ